MCKRFQYLTGFSLSILSACIIFISCGGGSSKSSAATPSTLDISSSNAVTGGTGKNGLNAFYPTTAYTGTSGTYTVLQGLSNQTKYNSAFPAFIDYTVNAASAGTYKLIITYSFGGNETNLRDCYIIVNGAKVTVDDNAILEFAYTGTSDGKWTTFVDTSEISVTLNAGDNDIRLSAVSDSTYTRTITYTRTGNGGTLGATAAGTVTGLPNIATLSISGNSTLSAGSATVAYYSLMTDVVDSASGSISVSSVQDCYLTGTQVTLKATAAANYKFDCWVGDVPSSSETSAVTISSNMFVAARFIPSGTAQPSGLVGYATVLDDKATGYTLTGGYGGTAVTVSTLADLKTYLTSTKPYIVTIEGEITSGDDKKSTSISVASNKTIYGSLTTQGKLKNIELKLNGENYIIRNLVSHEVVAYDGWKGSGNDNITINGAQHVWIDHCEFYSQLISGDCPDFSNAAETGTDGVINEYDYKDYYDGQIDISDEARWITISNNYFHDHWKSLLWGDSETDTGDAKIRVTLHHNYFKNIYSRLPMLRFGKAHVFNNYFDGITSLVIPATGTDFGYSSAGVDARCGATLLVEGNYYLNFKKAVFSSDGSGYVNANDNTYSNCNAGNSVTNTSSWTPGYSYSSYLQGSSVISSVTQTGWAGTGILTVLP